MRSQRAPSRPSIGYPLKELPSGDWDLLKVKSLPQVQFLEKSHLQAKRNGFEIRPTHSSIVTDQGTQDWGKSEDTQGRQPSLQPPLGREHPHLVQPLTL